MHQYLLSFELGIEILERKHLVVVRVYFWLSALASLLVVLGDHKWYWDDCKANKILLCYLSSHEIGFELTTDQTKQKMVRPMQWRDCWEMSPSIRRWWKKIAIIWPRDSTSRYQGEHKLSLTKNKLPSPWAKRWAGAHLPSSYFLWVFHDI